jgi:L,D-peptidoglycan transpeptidase YkuD (ErfK/YbiS/YcfS/YnhG family)
VPLRFRMPRSSTSRVRTPLRAGRRIAVGVTAVVLALTSAACGGGADTGEGSGKAHGEAAVRKADPTRIPGVGDPLQKKIPRKARQVVAVYGEGRDSADATVRLYTRQGPGEKWHQDRDWHAHNGKKGWARNHRAGDRRSPVGVFTLSDAGGLKAAPDAKLPYTDSSAFTPPSYWPEKTRHDFDHVIAVDYNRAKGTSPLDPTRPQGQSRGGNIWLHLDHGSGTSGCVSISRSGMRYLLRTLDPERHPAVVMGDKAALAAR